MSYRLLALFLCVFSSVATATTITDTSSALIGLWQGARSTSTGCFPLSWKVNRKSDGTFLIYIFDQNNELLGVETGKWWANEASIFVQADIAKTADEYSYSVMNENLIEFTQVYANELADCKNEPPFVDRRIQNL